MESMFLNLVNLSVNASYLVIAIILLRFILKKSPKWVNCVLWGLVGLRLVLPFSLESMFSLIPSNQFVDPNMINKNYFDIDTGFRKVDKRVNEYLGDNYFEGVTVPADTSLNITRIFMIIWLVGIIALLIYTLVSYLRLKKRVSTATLLRDNIKECEFVQSPFVLGIIKPTIYLLYNMDEKEQEYVIAHEKAHLKRFDHLIKPIGFLILTIHWFNPLMWIAYILLCRDIELACDEKVIKMLGTDERKDYSEALLSCSISRKSIAACPLAFGEVGVKERVKSVLSYKKPAFWIIIIAVVLSIVTAVCFLTVPKPCGIDDIDRGYLPKLESVDSVNIAGPPQAEYYDSKEDIEEIMNLLSSVKVSSNEIDGSMNGARNYVIMLNYTNDYGKYSITYNFNSRCTEIQVGDEFKPSYIYRVKNSDEIREKLTALLKETEERADSTENIANVGGVDAPNDIKISFTELYQMINPEESGKTEVSFEEPFIPFLALDEEKGMFQFFYDISSSYIAIGTYEFDMGVITATTSDKKYTYYFEKPNEDTVIFLADKSSKIKRTDEKTSFNVYDGAKFIYKEPVTSGENFFNATVLEVTENAVLVEPFKEFDESKSSDKIWLSLAWRPKNYPQMKVGDEIRVVYNGDIAETYPAQINTVFAIYFLEDIE